MSVRKMFFEKITQHQKFHPFHDNFGSFVWNKGHFSANEKIAPILKKRAKKWTKKKVFFFVKRNSVLF